jgi:hypothetical protein
MTRATSVIAGTIALVLASGCTDLVTETLRFGSVEVEAERRNGSPVPGVELILYDGTRTVALGVTDSEGKHLFEFLSPVRSFGVYAQPPQGYVRPEILLGGPTSAFVAPITVDEGEHRTVRFTYLRVGVGQVRVTVGEPGGSPVAQAQVTLYHPQGTQEERESDAGGEVLFHPVPFGIWGVRVTPPEVYLERDQTHFTQDGILVEEGSHELATFTLEKCQGMIRAEVLDHDGNPVASYPVTLYTAAGVVEEGLTEADGRRSFGPLLCRDFGLRIDPNPDWAFQEGRGTSFHDGILVTRGSDRTFTFRVIRNLGTIRGLVTDGEGAAVAGATLALYNAQQELERTVSDGEGAFAFSAVEVGPPHGVRVLPPEGFWVEEGRGTSFIDGLAPQAGEELEILFVLQRR